MSAQPVTLSEAVEAAQSHPNIEAAKADVTAAEASRKSVRSSFGPSLSTSAGLQVWNDEIKASFGSGGPAPQLPAPTTPYEEVVAGLVSNSSADVVIREQVTWDASVTVTQPITPLWTVYLGHRAATIGEEVAQTSVQQVDRDTAKDAAVAYFRTLQATAQLDTARQSVEQLESQQQRLADLVELGSVEPSQKLRIDVAVAAAKQDVFQAEADLELAQSALAVAMGRDPSKSVEAKGLDGLKADEIPVLSGDVQTWIEAARGGRPELAQIELQRQQVDLNVDIATAAHIPQLVALARYNHTEGQGLSGSDTFFVGAALEWTIWEWGRKAYEVDKAEAQQVKLTASQIQADRQIALQVKSAWLNARASRNALEVATAATEQATEAYRVETARYEAGSSTATELLDAQSALTQARNNETAALYQALIRRAELMHAAGKPINDTTILAGGAQ